MQFNIENIKKLVSAGYTYHAHMAFGEDGEPGIVELLDAIKLIYQHCPLEKFCGTLTVVLEVDVTPLNPAINSLGTPSKSSSYEELGRFLLSAGIGTHFVIEAVKDGSFRQIRLNDDFDLKTLAQTCLVYRYENETERILAKQYEDPIPKVSSALKSNFAKPTLASLEEALERYRLQMALHSKCKILAAIWEDGVDESRLILVNRPEKFMRDSLVQALSCLLTTDATVRPEHNTDETKPVDIRVEWFSSKAAAIIEIKWLGKSLAQSRDKSVTAEPTYTDYGLARAQAGAKQLADYLDRDVRHANPTNSTQGYLVIFDARRKHAKKPNDALNKEDALHFANANIDYDPDYAKNRSDFAPPYRFFLTPRESHFLPLDVQVFNS